MPPVRRLYRPRLKRRVKQNVYAAKLQHRNKLQAYVKKKQPALLLLVRKRPVKQAQDNVPRAHRQLQKRDRLNLRQLLIRLLLQRPRKKAKRVVPLHRKHVQRVPPLLPLARPPKRGKRVPNLPHLLNVQKQGKAQKSAGNGKTGRRRGICPPNMRTPAAKNLLHTASGRLFAPFQKSAGQYYGGKLNVGITA